MDDPKYVPPLRRPAHASGVLTGAELAPVPVTCYSCIMVSSARKLIAVLLLLVMVTNLCVWDSSRNRIAHQLGHVTLADGNAWTHGHAVATDDGMSKGKLAHQILHAVDHLQLFPDTPAGGAWPPPALAGAFTLHSDTVPPAGTPEPPYRPPSRLGA